MSLDPSKVGKAVLEGKGSIIMIDIEVTPGSSRSGIAGYDEWRNRLMVKVMAPPEKGLANNEVVEVMARSLGPKAHVELDKGATSHKKRLIVTGLSRDEVIQLVMEALH